MEINSSITSLEPSSTTRPVGEKSENPPTKISENISFEHQPHQPEKLAKLQALLAEHNISLKFRQDDQTHAVIVELVDGTTGEAIRQFPSEVSLKLAASFTKLQGVFINQQG